MKFTINRSVFLNQLSNVVRSIPSKSTISILTGIKLDLTHDELTLTGSDSEISIQSLLLTSDQEIGLEVERIGSVVLPARLFHDIVRKLPMDTFELDVNEQFVATIISGQATFNLVGITGEAYPHLPQIDEFAPIELPTTTFKQMISQTIFSASNQENRPILTGLHLVCHSNYLSAVATDSHRLSKREMPFELTNRQLEFDPITIPKKTMLEVLRIAEDDQTIAMVVSKQQIIFILGHITIYSRLLEGMYPDAERLIPTDYQTQIVVNAPTLLNAIDRASLMSREGSNNVVQMEITDEEVTLSVRGNELGRVAEVIETKAIEGQNLKISFNPDYMKDALKSFEGSDIKIQMQSPARPLLLQLETPSELENNRLLQLLTPIRTHQ